MIMAITPVSGFSQTEIQGSANPGNIKFEKISLPEEISMASINLIYQDSKGFLWIGTSEGLINYYGSTYDIYCHIPHDTNSLSRNEVISIIEDRSGNLWIGTWEGLNKFDPKTEKFTAFKNDPLNPKSLSDNRIFSLLKDSLGNLWIGTYGGGLNKLVPAEDEGQPPTFIYYRYDPQEPESLSNNVVLSMLEDNSGTLWIGTNGGLNKLVINESTGSARFTYYTTKDGLPNNKIIGLLEDNKGNIWISTKLSLSKFNPEAEDFSNYKKEDGIQNSGFGNHAYYKSESGELFFGGMYGLTAFYPDNIKDNSFIPPVEITKFSLFNKPVSHEYRDSPLEKSILYTDEIELSYKQNFLSFEFVSLNYSNLKENLYKYRMINLDPDTVYAGTRRFADYPDMKPGEYRFWVTGSNNDGIWNEEGRSIDIIIHPPWYKANLAYGSYGVLFFMALFGFIRWRTWSLKKDKEALEDQVKERTKQIAHQKDEIESQRDELEQTLDNLKQTQNQLVESEKMAALGGLVAGVAHEINTPVGIGVTAVSSLIEDTRRMAELYKKDQISRGDFKEFLQATNNSGKLIQKNLERTASLVQSFKQVSVDQSTEQQREFNLKSYLEDVIRSLYPKFKRRDIDINIDCDEELQLNSYPGVFAQIFTNLVLNSITHGFKEEKKKGVIDILVKQEDEQLNIEYKDNGEGIPQEILPKIFDPFFTTDQSKGTGLGLNIVYNLVTQKLKGSIKCDSEEGKGVVFRIVVPVGK